MNKRKRKKHQDKFNRDHQDLFNKGQRLLGYMARNFDKSLEETALRLQAELYWADQELSGLGGLKAWDKSK